MDADLVVTGSTGRLGGRVSRLLADAGVPQRLLVRDPSRAPALVGATVVEATYRDGAAVRTALEGARIVFMVSAAEAQDRIDEHRTFVDAAAAAGVEHLVYTSFVGAADDAVFTLARDHWATEEHIKASGLTWTFLRDNLYLDVLPLLAGPDGVIRGPAGEGRCAAVATDDIADAAVSVLTSAERHAGRTYTLTGPAALTMRAAAAELTRLTGVPVTYQEETLAEAYASRSSYGAPDWQVEAWVSTYAAIASGAMAAVTDDVLRLTGHPATSLEELLGRSGSALEDGSRQ